MGSLHIDYRPKNFEEMIGNKAIIKSLKSILKRKKEHIPHAMLFSGPSGSGKTTLARIVAAELGCPEKINGEVNGDFIELDIAHLTGIDTAREIRQTMHYYPSLAKCRVWILDEFHKSSNSFQNAMLKALEDTPKYAYFILCTTEPEKLLKTIRNRCSAFEVESLDDREIKQLLDWVLDQEEFDISDAVKDEIVMNVDGCPRQALVTLDQIIDLPDENQMLKSVKSASVDEKEIRELCQAMLKDSSWKKMSGILKGLKNEDPEKARQAIIHYMKTVMLNDTSGRGVASKAALIFDCFKEPVFYTGMAGIVADSFNTTALADIPPF